MTYGGNTFGGASYGSLTKRLVHRTVELLGSYKDKVVLSGLYNTTVELLGNDD